MQVLLSARTGAAFVLLAVVAAASIGLTSSGPLGESDLMVGAADDHIVDPAANLLLDGRPDDGLNRVIAALEDPTLTMDGRPSQRRSKRRNSRTPSVNAAAVEPALQVQIGGRDNDDRDDHDSRHDDDDDDDDGGRFADEDDLTTPDQELLDRIRGIGNEVSADLPAVSITTPTEVPTVLPAPTDTTPALPEPGSGQPGLLVEGLTDLDDLLQIPGIIDVREVGPGYVAITTSLTDTQIAALPGIAGVEQDAHRLLYADQYSQQWALRNTHTPGADIRWEESRLIEDGRGVVVAVIDTGIDLEHPDLASQMWFNRGETCGNGIDDDGNGYVDDCNGWDFANNDASVRDAGADNSHGTHVAGIIAGDDDSDGISGAAAGVEIMSLKIFHNGGASSSRLTAAINYAVDNGADVINLSLGGPSSTSAERAALQRANDAGIAVIAAAGNDRKNNDAYPSYPANYEYPVIVSVASSNISDNHSSQFSNYGRTSVDMHAPGEQIFSSLPSGRHGNMSGTSMATPYVSAVAALVVAQGRRGADVRQVLMDTARRLPQLEGLTVSGARLDAAAAVGGGRARGAEPEILFGSFHDGIEKTDDDVVVQIGADLTAMEVDAIDIRATLGASYGDDVYAVAEHTFTADGREVTSDEQGRLILNAEAIGADRSVTLRDGLDLGATWTLPAGDYAVMVEVIAAGGGTTAPALATPSMVFFRINPAPADPADPGDADDEPDTGDDSSTPPPSSDGGSGDGGSGGGGGSTPPPSGGGQPGITIGPDPGDDEPTPPPSDGGGGDGGSTPPPSSGGGSGGGSTPPPTSGDGGGGSTPPPSGDDGSGGGIVLTPPPSSGGGGGGSTPPSSGGGGGGSTPPPSGGGDGGSTPPPSSGGGDTTTPPDEEDPGQGDTVVAGTVSPSSGPPSQASVTITVPSGIADGAYVHFDGRNATILGRISANRVTVRPPSHAPGTVDVSIVQDGNRQTMPSAYTYLPADDAGPTEPPADGGGSTNPDPGTGDGTGGDAGGGGGSTPPSDGSTPPPADPVGPIEHNGLRLNPFDASSPMADVSPNRVSSQRCTQQTCSARTP